MTNPTHGISHLSTKQPFAIGKLPIRSFYGWAIISLMAGSIGFSALVVSSLNAAPKQPPPAPPSPGTAQVTEEEFVGPFPSWANLKTRYGAVGNGMVNDTTAFQAALNDLGTSSKPTMLYLSAGTYRITKTLTLEHRINVSIIGEDPSRTIIKWDGPPKNGVMLYINGVAYSRFNRITFNGSGKALVAVDQSWDGGQPHFDTGNEYADDVFQDVGYGIQGGNKGYGFAETAVMRSKFIRNSQAGIITKNFNALDLWVWHSTFQDCAKGITNNPGAGNRRVYNSLFKNSTITDLEIANTGGFSARDNTSIGSQAFLTTPGGSANPAEINLQGNSILDPETTTAINIGNQGPLFMYDNTISQPGKCKSRTSGTSHQLDGFRHNFYWQHLHGQQSDLRGKQTDHHR
jgi:hypothetical protein